MAIYQCVGVDVAKDKFDIAYSVNNQYRHKCFCNDKKGRREFAKWLEKNIQLPWVCMEATGHYSELIADDLVENDIRVSIVNPLQIKSFARVKLSRNKNDIIDAKIIAEYCEKMQPRTFISRSDSQKELKDLTKLLDTLKEQLVQLKNQLYSTQGNLAKKSIQKIIKELEKKIKAIEKQLADLVKKDEALNEKMALVTSVKGIGDITAYKILAQIPNIDAFSNAKQFAAYMGVSPKQHQSGKFNGRTTISRMGDSRLRKAIYMAALVAKRYNEALQPFVKRLELKGKSPKSIVCAVMRKLAHLVFGILKNNRPFDPKLA
jgi:transposase